jgi:hypothetical protein
MNLDDQREETANQLMKLGLFEVFCRPALREGEVGSDVYYENLASILADKETGEVSFPDQAVVAGVRSLLEQTAGMPVKTLLAEQDALFPTAQQAMPRPNAPEPAIASPQRKADGQPAAEKAGTAQQPLPPRRHRIPSRKE